MKFSGQPTQDSNSKTMVATLSKTVRKHIFLHPVDKKRRYAALKAVLLKDKKKYSDKLEGALLDVSHLKVVGHHHLVVDGYISMEVEADCLVFNPRPGQILEGVINKQSHSHLGCLVMEIFNAALAMPSQADLVPQIGDVVSFAVTEVVVDGAILFMRGSLERILARAKPEPVEEQEEPSISAAVTVKQEPEESPYMQTQTEMSDQETTEPHTLEQKVVFKSEPQDLSSSDGSPSKKKKKKKKIKDV